MYVYNSWRQQDKITPAFRNSTKPVIEHDLHLLHLVCAPAGRQALQQASKQWRIQGALGKLKTPPKRPKPYSLYIREGLPEVMAVES